MLKNLYWVGRYLMGKADLRGMSSKDKLSVIIQDVANQY